MAYIRFSKYTKIGQQSFHGRVWYRVSADEAKEMHELYPASSAILLKGKPADPSPVGDSVEADLAAVVKLPGEVEAAHAELMTKLEKEAEPKKQKVAKEEAEEIVEEAEVEEIEEIEEETEEEVIEEEIVEQEIEEAPEEKIEEEGKESD